MPSFAAGRRSTPPARGIRNLSPPDHALAVAIAGEALRRLPDLDALIDSATRQRLPDDSKARMVLRLALAQKVGLGTPDHALVATALPLVDGGPRRLVHGVLGTLLRRGVPAMDAPRLPAEVEERWREAWGDEGGRGGAAADREAAAARPDLRRRCRGAGLCGRARRNLARAAITSGCKALRSPSLPGFGEGRWWVQDLAASLPARLIPPTAEDVLDLCAAPGGKTMQLAAAGHRVTAVDASESRLGRLRENLAPHASRSASSSKPMRLKWMPEPPVRRDPARCALLGNRHVPPPSRSPLPCAARRSSPTAPQLQRELLDRAAQWLKPGGSLVYSVCSLEPQEGEDVVRAVLGRPSRIRTSTHQPRCLRFVPVSPEGWVRILPGLLEAEGGLDGFFMARLVRAG